jgi:hypothetical protein
VTCRNPDYYKAQPSCRRQAKSPFNINFYVLNAKGEYAGVSMYANEQSKYAVCTENGAQSLPIEPLLGGQATE